MIFWKAAAYQLGDGSWREGKVHRVSDEDPTKTLCGKTLAEFTGEFVSATIPSCKVCARSPSVIERRAAQEIEWRERSRQYEEERQQQIEERRREYEIYIQSPTWKELRRKVLVRANHTCEGCGKARATDAHHLTYERFRQEMLFDLVAVCRACHEQIHNREFGL